MNRKLFRDKDFTVDISIRHRWRERSSSTAGEISLRESAGLVRGSQCPGRQSDGLRAGFMINVCIEKLLITQPLRTANDAID